MLNPNFGVVPFEWNDIIDWNPSQGMYARFHTHVRGQNPSIKTLISLGGWTFNEREATKSIFTNMVETQVGRARFIQSAISFARTHSFDGVDIDWEYPAHAGQGGRPQDKANFVFLLAEFRAAIAAEAAAQGVEPLLLTIAVGAAGPTVENGYQIDQIHQHLDWIGVMTYDLHGSWEATTGMHTSMDGNDPMSVLNGMQQWMDGGAPADKLVMGFATYGRGWTLTDAASSAIGAAASGGCTAGAVTNAPGFLASYEIQALVDRGGAAVYDAGTKSMYAHAGDQWVGYDNAATLREKVGYMGENDFAGGMVWALDLDDFKNGYPLISAIKDAMDVLPTANPVTTTMDGGWTWSPTSPTPAPTPAPSVTPSVFVWAPLNKLVPSFGATDHGIIASRFAEQLNVASLRVAGIGAVSIELDQQQAWSFAAAFRPDLEWPPGGTPPTPAPAAATTGQCSGCHAGVLGDCKRLSDSTCWGLNAVDGTCPFGTVECANEDNTVAVELGIDVFDPTLQGRFSQSMADLLCEERNCTDVVQVVIVDVTVKNGTAVPGRARQLALLLTRVEFYMVEGQHVIPGTAAIAVAEAADEIAGATVSEVVTQAAIHGPNVEFDCDALPSRNCSSMQAACDVWCRGPSQPDTCDVQAQEPGSYPLGTTAHRCACVLSPAQTVCTFESTVQAIAWTVDSPMLVFIVDHGDVLAFGDNSDTTVSVSKLVSEAAYDNCDFTGAVPVTPQETNVLYTAAEPGDLFFAHPAECLNGLKVQVVVRDSDEIVQITPGPTPAPTTVCLGEPVTSFCYSVRTVWGPP